MSRREFTKVKYLNRIFEDIFQKEMKTRCYRLREIAPVRRPLCKFASTWEYATYIFEYDLCGCAGFRNR